MGGSRSLLLRISRATASWELPFWSYDAPLYMRYWLKAARRTWRALLEQPALVSMEPSGWTVAWSRMPFHCTLQVRSAVAYPMSLAGLFDPNSSPACLWWCALDRINPLGSSAALGWVPAVPPTYTKGGLYRILSHYPAWPCFSLRLTQQH